MGASASLTLPVRMPSFPAQAVSELLRESWLKVRVSIGNDSNVAALVAADSSMAKVERHRPVFAAKPAGQGLRSREPRSLARLPVKRFEFGGGAARVR